MKKAVCLLFLLVLSSSAARAGVQPNGPVLHASTCTTCKMWSPSVAGSASGTFSVAWEGTSTADSRGIFARFYTKNGAPRGKEVLVNKEKEPAQYDAAVAVDAQGNYIVTWSQIGSDRNSDVFVQRFSSLGAPLGAAVRVNVDDPAAPPDDALPVIASTPGSGFVVAWTRIAQPGATPEEPRPEIMVRRFDKNAAPLGAPVQLNTGKARGQRPDVCISKAGQAVVAWATVDDYYPFQPSKYGVSLRRVKATGAPDGAEVVVSRPTADVVDVAASCASDGSHVIVWRSNLAPSTDGSDLLGLRFTAKGRRSGNVFRVNTGTVGEQYMPAVSHDAAGNFVVVWVSRNGSDQNIIGRRFRANGTADGADFVVYEQVELSLPPTEPDVSHVGAAGGFVAAWQIGSEDVGVRRFKITAGARR